MSSRRTREGHAREIDFEIIAHLQEDTRKPFTAIGEELGLPESTIRKRVSRLKRIGILHFAAFADPLRLGFQYWSLIQVHVDLAGLERTTAILARRPKIFFVGITTGAHNLFVAGVFRSNEDLLDFLTTRLPRLPGVRATTSSNVLRILKRRGPTFGRLRTDRPFHAPVDGLASPEVTMLDKRMITALQNDGRKPLAQLAAQLEVAESTVHQRVSRLRQLGILQFETFPDPVLRQNPVLPPSS